MKNFIFVSMLMLPFLGYSQWTKTSLRTQKVKASQEKLEYAGLYSLDANQLKQALKDAPERFSGSKGVIVSLPTAGGKIEKFQVWESSNMDPALQKKYPDIKSYVGTGIEDPSVYLRFSMSPVGFSSMITRSGMSEFIEPYTEDRTVYAVFDSNARRGQDKEPFECSTPDKPKAKDSEKKNEAANKKLAGFNVFRLAITCTGEYAQYHLTAAGTPANATEAQKKAVVLAAMNASLTRMNGVFEKDLSLHFNLVANNDAVIYVDPATDPYGEFDEQNPQAQTTITNNIGAANYDMGHIFDKEDGNGYAPGEICDDASKAQGWTASNFPEGDTFDIDYVAHEMGHQLGANHSYSYQNGSADPTSLVEPGSGSTIMAYTGITNAYDVQFNSNDYFHTFNITEIKNTINALACGVNTPFANPAPNISAGADYTIPKSTPFVLKATTTDANTAAYTYTWEQMDAASGQFGNNSIPYTAKPAGPVFRSFEPVNKLVRYFPDFNNVLAGVLITKWETVSSVARNLNFAVTVRNNDITAPQTNKDAMSIAVNGAAGPFKVTAPTFGQAAVSGASVNVTWDVANTTQAPVSTANVNIKLSTDGGQTFTTVAANTPNDGSEQVTIPSGSTSANAYILVEAAGNIYYAVSPSFVIDYTIAGETCTTYTYEGAAVAITDGPGGNAAIASPKVSVPLMVNNPGIVTKIKVIPSITHPYVKDLSIGIEGPLGTSALVWNRQCGSQDNITATFSDAGNAAVCATPIQGEVKSNESLGIFVGHPAQGQWKLFASDNYTEDAGSITGWSLQVCTRQTQALGVKDTASPLADDIKIYPNPSDGNFFIKSRNLKGEVKVGMFDASGKLVFSSAYQSENNSTKEFNVNVPKGVYVISITSSKGAYNTKLVIK
ncbi:T9SS type A sorting domain-containing protein [Chryseobacterium sp. L7]|uniref:T9SS type A sorting domain-containing protein n=1 Tax=Chryseobacterium endalhagicum TaxID=2797638 RepID=A0ABS1QKM7_9FLAO|nr:zinc-dependent metalloprotease family protein [Chryseobacterium endalhagicum]MBL1222807.1 T9SS type A sorting domain-containing protein [Chryseobacterium endalhagicum]